MLSRLLFIYQTPLKLVLLFLLLCIIPKGCQFFFIQELKIKIKLIVTACYVSKVEVLKTQFTLKLRWMFITKMTLDIPY